MNVTVRPPGYLKAGEEGAIVALCETAWQLGVNREADLLSKKGFLFFRIRGRAEVLLGRTPAGRKAARLAMPELNRVINLETYDKAVNSGYRKGCNL